MAVNIPDCPNCGVSGDSCPQYDHDHIVRCYNSDCAVHEFHNAEATDTAQNQTEMQEDN